MKPKKTIKIVDGKQKVFYLVPASDYTNLKQKVKYTRERLLKLRVVNRKYNSSVLYYKRIIKQKIKEIDVIIERLEIEKNERG